MINSRIGRLEEKRQWKRIILAGLGSLALVCFVLIFGFKLLEGFSIMVEKLHGGNSPQPQNQPQSILLAPILDPPPEATFTGIITVSGSAQGGKTVVIYNNDQETKKIGLQNDGNFLVKDFPLQEGSNVITAKILDEKGKTSDISQSYTVLLKKKPPKLDVSDPAPGTTKNGDDKSIDVKGITESNTRVTVNDHMVILHSDGSFEYLVSLTDGDNLIRIVATDQATNQTIVERHVTYHQ